MTSANELLKQAKRNGTSLDPDLFQLAYEFAEQAHHGQKRLSGEPYFSHATATAEKLIELGLDQPTIIAGLLHDVPEDTSVTIETVERDFGKEIANLVRAVTKLGKLKYRGMDRYVENLRRMFIAMARDIRVIIIKFADRLNNLATLQFLPPEKQKRIASETLEIYAPIANRLGMGSIKGELEDAAFRFAYPKSYEQLVARIQEPVSERSAYLTKVKQIVESELTKDNIPITLIDGRTKHLFSLLRKLKEHGDDLSKIYDLVALRIIVTTLSDCYAALGTIHRIWTPLKGRIKDYIAQPKPNGYQSLHSTVFCEEGKIVEFQIRTLEMHRLAEHGIAAHWQYDEAKRSETIRKQFGWVNTILKRQQDFHDRDQYLDSLKLDVFKNQIYVFTPEGDVLELPEDATPVDFAYTIHSDIGDHCSQAIVNDRQVSLDTPLKSGDVCQIITDKNRHGANPDWLDFVKTSSARSKIRHNVRRR